MNNPISSHGTVEIVLSEINAILRLSIANSKDNDDPKTTYFKGVTNGDQYQSNGLELNHIIKCLEFHTQFAQDEWIQVPVVLLAPWTDNKQILSDLKTLYNDTDIDFEEESVQQSDEVNIHRWKTNTFGSSHFFYVEAKNKEAVIRIGPMAGTVLNKYVFEFAVLDTP